MQSPNICTRKGMEILLGLGTVSVWLFVMFMIL